MSTNPYILDDATPKLRESVFVYMDILGYQDIVIKSIKEKKQEVLLNLLHSALSKGHWWLKGLDVEVRKELRMSSGKEQFAIKAFTDNIVMGFPIHEDAEHELGHAFQNLSFFQLEMVTNGFFIRGAISIGNAYIDDIAVFGDALIEAYEGENNFARDPRIILTKSSVRAIKKHISYYSKGYAPQTRDVLIDADGQYFLNYLDCIMIAEDEHGPYFDELKKHKISVEKKLEEYRLKPHIWSKYAWVAGYHNYFCDLHQHYFNDEFKVNVDLFKAKPKLIDK